MSICCGRPQSVCNYIARVKVIGNGDDTCKAQVSNCQEAIDALKMAIALDEFDTEDKIKEFGIKEIPAIVIGSKVVSEGKLLSAEETQKLIKKSLFGF